MTTDTTPQTTGGTVARPTQEQSCHWYAKDGTPVYEVPRAKGEGMRPTTLADARKLSLLPSVTTILSILRKPQLESWLIEQACLAVLTAPRPTDEPLDAFVERILHTERHQDQESDIAKKRGTEIHDAIEDYFKGEKLDGEIWTWIEPVIAFLVGFGHAREMESIVVSRNGYAGRVDLVQLKLKEQCLHIWDFKTTKKLPKQAYQEHKLQLSAYANALPPKTCRITTGNIYISTLEKGKFVVCEHDDSWPEMYDEGFHPLLKHWRWANDYRP